MNLFIQNEKKDLLRAGKRLLEDSFLYQPVWTFFYKTCIVKQEIETIRETR